jgi:putative endonuclease
MYWVYILLSKKNLRTYVGYTSDLQSRLDRHNKGYVRSTKNRIPLVLLHSEVFRAMKEAKARGKWWKSSSGRKELMKLFG